MFGSSNSSRDSTRTWRMAEMLRGGQAACSEASGVLSNEGRVRRHVIEPAALIWAASESAGDGMDRRNFIGSAALAALLPLVGGGSEIAATRGRLLPVAPWRSDERRVGKEWVRRGRSRWGAAP